MARPPLRRLGGSSTPRPHQKKPGPKPKPLDQRTCPEIRPLRRVERSYTRERKIQVLCFLYHYRVPFVDRDGVEKTRAVRQDEAASVFLIPTSTIQTWWTNRDKIIQSSKGQRTVQVAFVCQWPEMEEKLFTAFVKRREEGKTVRRGWFRRTSKRIFKECYARLGESLFCFSSGWFSGFLSRHHISLRFTTNKAQKIPDDYQQLVVNWFQFNRRNSQLRPEDLQARPHVFLEVVLARDVGRYYLSNICNLDETPLPFEYLEGRTYSIKGLKTIWAKTIRSGWDKRQATLILCIFADGISRIRPVIIFHGKGSSRMDAERKLYDKRVMVEFNPTAYNNEQLFLKYIDQHLLPALGGRPSLFAFDCVEFHKTSAVRRKLLENDVIPSVVPPGCTGLVQPLDISVNKPLKSLMQDFTDEAIEQRGEEHDKWTVGEMRVLTTHCVASAWDDLCKNKRQVVVDSFRHVGLSLPVDGSRDSELCVKGFAPGTLEVGDWRAGAQESVDEELILGDSVGENSTLGSDGDESEAVEFVGQGEES